MKISKISDSSLFGYQLYDLFINTTLYLKKGLAFSSIFVSFNRGHFLKTNGIKTFLARQDWLILKTLLL